MMEAIKRMAVAYGKLGLSTDPELIARRAAGVKTVADGLELAELAALVQSAFEIGAGAGRFAFLSGFAADLTFDVRPTDREAVLLAGAVAEYAMENEIFCSPQLALTVVACACGGLRSPSIHDQLLAVAQRHLAQAQGRRATKPKDRTYVKQPKTLTDAVGTVQTSASQYFSQSAPYVTAALQAVAKYAESIAISAATSDKEMLSYVGSLEQEMQTYRWVTGGWSDDAAKPFRQLSAPLAAICAGAELARKHSSPLGLFAAPALIDLVLERGRPSPVGNISFQDAAGAPGLDWRKRNYVDPAAGPLAALMPITAALGLSAASEDADDWKPRFNRLTGLEPDAVLPAAEFGFQLYRERLVARALA